MVGLRQVGIVGLRKAVARAAEEGLVDREEIVDLLLTILAEENYIPDPDNREYRTAIWREYLRDRGEDISPYFSPVPVIVRGAPGSRRDEFEVLAREVFAEHELAPLVQYDASGDGALPELVIDGTVVVSGPHSRSTFKAAVRRSFSDW